MLSFYRKYWRTALDIGLIALTVYLIMFTFSYLYSIAAPIFLAFIVFWMIEPLARLLHRGKLKKSLASAISVFLFIVLILGVIVGGIILFIAQASNLSDKLPQYGQVMQEQINYQTDYWQGKIQLIPQDILDEIFETLKSLGGLIAQKGTQFTGWLIASLVGMVSSVSTFVINFVIGILLAYFLSVEIDSWRKFANEKTPNTFKLAFVFLRENVLKGIATYVKAQSILVSVTFIIILISLLLLGVDNAFTISLLAAIFDVLPLLGVSTVFIPWIIYLLIVGNTSLAIWLTALWLVVIIARQILEPKITGDSLGVSAFTMLSFMIISLSLFGIAGLIISPILIILIKALYEQGYLKKWIRLPAEEYEPISKE